MAIARMRIKLAAILLVLVVSFSMFVPLADAASLGGTTIRNGVTMTWKEWTIEKDVYATFSFNFSTEVPSTVKAGYRLQTALSNVYTATGNGTKTLSGSFTAPATGMYNVNVYNGSSDTITVKSGTLTF